MNQSDKNATLREHLRRTLNGQDLTDGTPDEAALVVAQSGLFPIAAEQAQVAAAALEVMKMNFPHGTDVKDVMRAIGEHYGPQGYEEKSVAESGSNLTFILYHDKNGVKLFVTLIVVSDSDTGILMNISTQVY